MLIYPGGRIQRRFPGHPFQHIQSVFLLPSNWSCHTAVRPICPQASAAVTLLLPRCPDRGPIQGPCSGLYARASSVAVLRHCPLGTHTYELGYTVQRKVSQSPRVEFQGPFYLLSISSVHQVLVRLLVSFLVCVSVSELIGKAPSVKQAQCYTSYLTQHSLICPRFTRVGAVMTGNLS